MDQSNTMPCLQRTNCPSHPHLPFVTVSLFCPNAWLKTPWWDSKRRWCLHQTYTFVCGYLYVHFSQSFSLHLVDFFSGTSGSYPSTLNGILSPGRRGSVGPWSVLSVSSIEWGNIRIQIFYFVNRYSCSLRSLECRRIYFSMWKFIDKSWQYCWIGHNWVRLHNSNSSRVSHHALNLKRAQLSSIIHFQWGISCQTSFWTCGWWKSKLASNIWSHWFSKH